MDQNHLEKPRSSNQNIKMWYCWRNNSLKASIQATTDLTTKFETSAPDTPEKNGGMVQRKFQTLYAKVRSAINGARLPKDLENGLWAHYAETMTKLENLLVDQGGDKGLAQTSTVRSLWINKKADFQLQTSTSLSKYCQPVRNKPLFIVLSLNTATSIKLKFVETKVAYL